jgi:hypothetical protein
MWRPCPQLKALAVVKKKKLKALAAFDKVASLSSRWQ